VEALDRPAHTLYVANVHGDNNKFGADGRLVGSLSVINTDACNSTHLTACRRAVVATVHTGEWPLGIAVDPLTHSLYVANDGDHDVSVINAAECDATDTTGCQAPST